jgi:hypothetical protein
MAESPLMAESQKVTSRDFENGGGIRIRTLEGIASRFTVCPV